jgi:DNA-binding transcriptional LysR family regulator
LPRQSEGSVTLRRLNAGRLDLIVISVGRNGGEPEDAELIATDAIVWVGAVGGQAHERRPLPIAVSGPSCAWRAAAIDALERAGVPFRIAYSSANYAGQYAAAAAGLAVATFAASALDERLRRLGPADGLPRLPNYQLWLKVRDGAGTPALTALSEHVRASFAG